MSKKRKAEKEKNADNLLKFEDWAEWYFENKEDPCNKYGAKTFDEYCKRSAIGYNAKNKYNYIQDLKLKILRRVQIIHGGYISMYIRKYDKNENNIHTQKTSRGQYTKIIDMFFPELNFEDEELTACRNRAQKHYKRYEQLKNDLEKKYMKLPFEITSEQIDEVFSEVFQTNDIDVIWSIHITNQHEKEFSNIMYNRFGVKSNYENILNTLIGIKDHESKLHNCERLFSNIVNKYYTLDKIADQKRFKFITKEEAKAYEYILDIMNNNNFSNINLLRKLEENYWELLNDKQKKCLIHCIEIIQETENWEDVSFDIENIEYTFKKPFLYRNMLRIVRIGDLFYAKDNYENKTKADIEKLMLQTDKYMNKFYCKYIKIFDNGDEKDFDLEEQIEAGLKDKGLI